MEKYKKKRKKHAWFTKAQCKLPALSMPTFPLLSDLQDEGRREKVMLHM